MLPAIQGDGYYLTREEMLAIRSREYHYNAWSSTILDPYMQPFWRWVITFIPLWVAPSTLSLCGLVCNVVATAVTVYFAPTMTETLPSWVCIMNAISIFLYQTFDGIDGKQSYLVQNSEVEEYADHAVDSISITLNAVLLAAALQLGDSPILLGSNLMMALTAFFVAHWAAHSTNSLIFGRIDVTEAQWSMIAIHLVSAAGGPAFWDKTIFGTYSIHLKDVVCLTTAATMFFASAANVAVAMGLRETPLESNGIRIPRTRLTMWPFLTYLIVCIGAWLCLVDGLLTSISLPTLLIVGLAMGKAGTAMILQKLARKHGPMIDMASFSPLALFALSKVAALYSDALTGVAWALLVVLAADICIYHEHATSDLKTARGLQRFILNVGPDPEGPKATGFYVSGGNLASTQKAWRAFAGNAARVKATYP